MGRGGKRWARRSRGRAAGKCSDESDEDYTVGDEDEMDDSEDEYVSSFDGDESEEIFGEFEDEEEEEEEEEEFIEKKVRGPKKVVHGRKRNGVVKLKKKQKVSFRIQSDNDCEDSEEYEYDGGIMNRVTTTRKKKKVSYRGLDDNDDLDEYAGKRTNGLTNSRKKNKVSYREQEDDDYDDSDEFDGVKNNGVPKSRRKKLPCSEQENDDVDECDGEKSNGVTISRKKKKVSYEEQEDDDCDDRKKKRVSYKEQDDENYVVSNDDDDDDDDEEFTLDEIDDLDDEEIIMETKKDKKLGRPRRLERIPKDCKRKRNSKVLGNNMVRKTARTYGLATKTRSKNHIEFADCENRIKEKKMKIMRQEGRKKRSTNSDSDFETSGLSDYEYTISEEEREQIREANAFCRRLTNCLRSAAPVKKLQEEQKSIPPQIKRPGRKGKEKEEEVKPEKGKQVCGICLSEEGKRTVQGTLDCCSHYFCFTCIMEWSKVESRCPLCKQRFVTISKTARFDLRPMVISVPVRDQVYQPSEEELRGYLDPYENVMCTECQQGGDDALMLLCDLCDSPAHTYCVGLGHEVPEGNWYCEGCRPTALDTSNPQSLNSTPGYRATNNLSSGSPPAANIRETFDLNEAYVPDTPVTPVPGLPSPRLSVGDSQAFTVLERRRIQQQIRQIFNHRRLQDYEANGTVPPHSGNNLVGSQLGRGRVLVPQHSLMSERTGASYISPFRGQIHENSAGILPHAEGFPARLNHFRGPVMQGQASTSANGSFGGLMQNEVVGTNARVSYGSGLQQMQPCSSRSNIGSEAGASVHPCREVSPFNVEKEQLQSMVRSHLKRFSRDLDVGHSTFKDIARSSTHTILAACGLQHQPSEVFSVQTPLLCAHVEGGMVGGRICRVKSRCCSSCFDLFVKDVVKEIFISRTQIHEVGQDSSN